MKSVKLVDIRKFFIEEIEIPQVKPGQVLVKMETVGVCGSDVHYFAQGRIGSDRCVFPQSLGHECAGIVVESAKDVSIPTGTRVAIEPALPCMQCEHCRTGHYNCCPNVKFLGSPGMPGGFQEYIALDKGQVVKIPDSIDFDEAALLEPLGVAYHAVRLSDLKAAQTIAIFGAGPIGLNTAAMAQACGAGEIFLFDKLQYRLDFAQKEYGITNICNVTSNDPIEYIKDKTKGRGVDITFEAVGHPDTFNWSFECARISGKAMIIGIPEVDSIAMNPHPMRRRELCIQNVRRSNLALEPSIDLVERGRISIKALATHHFNLLDIHNAFRMVEKYQDGVIKAIITF